MVTATLGVQLKAGDASSVAFVDADVQDYAPLVEFPSGDVEVDILNDETSGLKQIEVNSSTWPDPDTALVE